MEIRNKGDSHLGFGFELAKEKGCSVSVGHVAEVVLDRLLLVTPGNEIA